MNVWRKCLELLFVDDDFFGKYSYAILLSFDYGIVYCSFISGKTNWSVKKLGVIRRCRSIEIFVRNY